MKRLKEEIEVIATGGSGGGATWGAAAEELAVPAPMINPSYPNLNMSSYVGHHQPTTIHPSIYLINYPPNFHHKTLWSRKGKPHSVITTFR